MGQINKEGRKKGRENRIYENGEERWREKWDSGKKSTKIERERVEKGQNRVKDRKQIELKNFQGKRGE